jgi:hypothetical protein
MERSGVKNKNSAINFENSKGFQKFSNWLGKFKKPDGKIPQLAWKFIIQLRKFPIPVQIYQL